MATRPSVVQFIFILVALVFQFEESSSSICGLSHVEVNTTSGNFTSPNHPNKYPNNTVKIWNIVAPANRKIVVYFNVFNLEATSSLCNGTCGCDYVKIRNRCDDAVPIATYCGRKGSFSVQSSGNEMWIEFRSDGTIEGSGFSVLFTSEFLSCPRPSENPGNFAFCLTSGKVHCCKQDTAQCKVDKILTGESGTITSPGHPFKYPHNALYRWRITVPQGFVVQWNFTVMEIERSDRCSDCTCDYVELRDGPCNYYKGVNWCGSASVSGGPKPSYTSTGRHLYISFKSDGVTSHDGFKANYRIALECSGDKPISCLINAAPSCCKSDANVCRSTSTRSHCPRGNESAINRFCCMENGKPSCCSAAQVTPCSSEFTPSVLSCPGESDLSTKSVCCKVNGNPKCCSPEEAFVRCHDSGISRRTHCNNGTQCCLNGHVPACCFARNLRPWSLLIVWQTALFIMWQWFTNHG